MTLRYFVWENPPQVGEFVYVASDNLFGPDIYCKAHPVVATGQFRCDTRSEKYFFSEGCPVWVVELENGRYNVYAFAAEGKRFRRQLDGTHCLDPVLYQKSVVWETIEISCGSGLFELSEVSDFN